MFLKLIALAFLLTILPAEAQTSRGTVVGTVMDSSGAVAPAAAVNTRRIATKKCLTCMAHVSSYGGVMWVT